MAYKRIIVTLPKDFLYRLDTAVAADYTNRSTYIREAIALKMRLETAVEHAATDKDSMERLIHSLHFQRMSQRRINKTGPLTWNQVQD